MIKLPRPYLAFDSVLCEALQHNLSGLVPPPHHPSTLYPLPTVVFRMFDYTDCPEGPILPGQHSIERWLIEEQLNHILMSGFKERKEVAAQLLSYGVIGKFCLLHFEQCSAGASPHKPSLFQSVSCMVCLRQNGN